MLSLYLFTNPGHFSQVIWKGTQKVGIGTAQSKSGNFFLVARYDPKGNVDGTFNDNVPKPLPGNRLTIELFYRKEGPLISRGEG